MNKIVKAMCIVLFVAVLFNQVIADRNLIHMPGVPAYRENEVSGELRTQIERIWGSVVIIVQMISLGCVIFAGIRYMFASADQRADIKKGLIYIVIGSILVFSVVTITDFIVNAFDEITDISDWYRPDLE